MNGGLSAWIQKLRRKVDPGFRKREEESRLRGKFEEIYANNEWKYGSGEGSRPENTREYVALLEKFLVDHQITSIVDMGCGDWQFSKDVKWGDADYLGYDVVGPVVRRNRRKYKSAKIRFRLYSGDPAELPAADLLIVKDVLQHLSNAAITHFLPHVSRYKYALITNCVNPRGPTEHTDIDHGEFRYLDLRLPPFNVKADELLTYTHAINLVKNPQAKPWWRKMVLLIERGG